MQAPDGTPAAYINDQPDSAVCRGMDDPVLMANPGSRDILADAYQRRGLNRKRCDFALKSPTGNAPAIEEESTASKVGKVVAAVAVIGLVALAASAGGGGRSAAPAARAHDYDWEWDQFYNEFNQLVWACRGRQTGQFAYPERCQFKVKADLTWPGWVLTR